jgi:hypothetical protein
MANLTTTADLKAQVLTNAGEVTSGTSSYDTLALTYLNRAQLEVATGGSTFVPDLAEPWPWAKAQSPGVLRLVAPYAAGTVTVTNGSTSATLSAASSASLAGYYLAISGRPEYFRISAHTAATTALTLDAAYTDESGSGLSFNAYKLDYALTTGIARLIEPMRVYRTQVFNNDNEGKIYGIAYDEMLRSYPLHLLRSGVPTLFAQIGEVDGAYRVRFNASVAQDTRVEYEYIPIPSALTASPDTTPILPYVDRPFLVYAATFWLMLDKSDSRADYYFRLAQAKLQNMLSVRRRNYGATSKNAFRVLSRQDQIDVHVLRGLNDLRY